MCENKVKSATSYSKFARKAAWKMPDLIYFSISQKLQINFHFPEKSVPNDQNMFGELMRKGEEGYSNIFSIGLCRL